MSLRRMLYLLLVLPAILSGQTLVYSTHVNGTDLYVPTATAVDSAGNSYITGTVSGPKLAPTNVLAQACATLASCGNYVFVVKLSPTGTMIYSTLIGGPAVISANAIAIDAGGSVYITGQTTATFSISSPSTPVTGIPAPYAAYVAKLNPSGSAFVYVTYLGGGQSDSGNAIAVDSAGNAIVTGVTASSTFPQVNAAQTSGPGNGYTFGFISKINPAGSALLYSTYLGAGQNGVAPTVPHAVTLDSTGNAYVAGEAGTGLPLLNPLPYGTTGGLPQGFIAKYSSTGTLQYSTYLGGAADQSQIKAIAVDSAGSMYVCGTTRAKDYPTVNPIHGTFGGATTDGFLSKLNAAGSALVYSTFYGGSGDDSCNSVSVDGSGNAYIVGKTSSTDFPLFNALQSSAAQLFADGYIAKINTGGSAAIYSMRIGDGVAGAAINGNAYITGDTDGIFDDFPLLPAQQSAFDRHSHAWVAEISDATAATCGYYVRPTITLPSGLQVGNAFAYQSSNILVTTNTALCSWQASGGTSWLAVTGTSGTGIGNAVILVAPNTGTTPRTATLTIAGQSVQVTQAAPTHIDVGSASGLPGQIARVPLTATLETGNSFGFSISLILVVTPNGSAPAITGSTIGFQPDPSLPTPGITFPGTAGTANVFFTALSPLRNGTFPLGELLIPIPAGATTAQSYSVVATRAIFNGVTFSNAIIPTIAGPSLPGTVTVGTPVPVALSLLPSSSVPIASTATVVVNGEGFAPTSTVLVNGSPRTTMFISETQLSATLTASDLVASGSVQITVSNLAPGGGVSNALTFLITSNPTPIVSAAGIVNSADYTARVSGGSLVSLFGGNLAPSPAGATAIPLLTSLNGVSVLVDGIPAPMLYVNNTQINFQMPWRTLNETQASIVVNNNGESSAPVTVPILATSPGIYTLNSQGTGPGAVIYKAGSTSAKVGDTISFFLTGLGLSHENLTDGTAEVDLGGANCTMCPLTNLQDPTTVVKAQATVAGIPATVTYSGLAPGFVGLYQVNLTIPTGVATGSAVPVVITMNGSKSNTATIAVQ